MVCLGCGNRPFAEELHLDSHTVKELEKQYMQEQLPRGGRGAARIGIDEVSIGKRHTYRPHRRARLAAGSGLSGSVVRTARDEDGESF